MGKAARLRAERKAKGEVEPQRPVAHRGIRPSIAKDLRKKQAAAFRAWRNLPLAERRAPLKGTAFEQDATHITEEKEASA